MEKSQFWEKYINDLLTDNYQLILTKDQINKRVKAFADNLDKIPIDKLYRNILFLSVDYCQIFLDYKKKIISEDYLNTFINPTSVEIDDNEYLSEEDMKYLNTAINSSIMIINNHIDDIFINKLEYGVLSINECHKCNSDIITVHIPLKCKEEFVDKIYEDTIIMQLRCDLLIYMITSQLYSTNKEFNPWTKEVFSGDLIRKVQDDYSLQIKIYKKFFDKYPQGLSEDERDYFFK